MPRLRTPHADALAAEGVVFDRYFATAPLCSPSRGAMLTGCYPHVNGLMGLVNCGWDLPDRLPTLPQLLGAAGYETYLFGFHHEKRDPRRMGYADRVQAEGPYHAEAVVPLVCDFLAQVGRGARRRPFAAVVGLSEVHRPFRHPRYVPDDPARVAVPGWLPDDPRVRQDLAELHGLIAAADTGLGRLTEALGRAGLAERTLVLFTCDHGIAFPRAKSTLYDAGIGIALVARWPGVLPAGVRCDALLSNVDLAPSLLVAVGAQVPGHMNGRPFWGAVPGACGPGSPAWVPREAVFAEKTYHDEYDPMRAVRTARWKYVRSFEPRPELVLPADIAASLSAEVPALAAATRRPRAPEELYDVLDDPDELRNLAGAAGYAGVLVEMRSRLDAWMRETDDPLLRGPVPDAAG